MDESTSGNDPSKGAVSDQRIGSYRVLEPLGSGGMSSVFRAIHEESGHEVALKVLTRTLARNSTLLQRFMREARSAETLEHQNIVTIYDRGIDRGRHYLALEYVAGGDFHEYVQRQGPLRANDAIAIVKSVASGLRYAAKRGLIHRDVKPSNILRTPAGQVKIIDLGLALHNEFEDERVTREGTTVGTVDYMAPEQARDSRATSIQSDIYSLGCTLYYLLTGVPAYPGGDITDKLTRHARSPVPDVRDLRTDVSPAVSAILQRMMAKKPEERFASYDDLIAALDATQADAPGREGGIALVPLADEQAEAPPPLALDSWPERESAEYATRADDPDASPRPEVSLAELALEQSNEIRQRPATRALTTPPPPLRRRGLENGDVHEDDPSSMDELAVVPAPTQAPSSASVWIIAGAFTAVALFLLVLGLVQFMDSSAPTKYELATHGDTSPAVDPADSIAASQHVAVVTKSTLRANFERKGLPKDRKTPTAAAIAKWVEPADTQPTEDAATAAKDAVERSRLLPEWARSTVPDRIDGPFVVVRRVVESGETSSVPTLYMALDQRIGGTVEIADEGPFFNDDFRVAGASRLIRARPGIRPIVRVERSSSQAVRNQPAVFVLDGQNLILDGIDLVVDVRDIYPEQTALFSCRGSALTLRNCSITILNHNNTPFSIVRAQPGGARPTRIRMERCFLRGGFGAGVELAGSGSELSLDRTVIVGGPGPTIRLRRSPSTAETRLFVVDSILAGLGPTIELSGHDEKGPVKPLSIRSFGSVFGRLHGMGVASVIASASATEDAAKQIDWKGNRNLFAGWKGFFACGKDPIVIVPGLAEVRSTWNGADQESQEILSPWLYSTDLAALTRDELGPFVPNREKILRQVAQPRAGLFEKGIGEYPSPAIPEPAGWAFDLPAPAQKALPAPMSRGVNRAEQYDTPHAAGARSPAVTHEAADPSELTFDTSDSRWGGDLGVFLRDGLKSEMNHVRVRVIGSGHHRFTPVQLARDLYLEIRVEPLAAAEPPSWSPTPNATGPALIELYGGALVISHFNLRHDQSSHLEHLIHVEDADLVLSRCQITAPGPSGEFAGDLIAFRSPSTEPYPADAGRPIFTNRQNRPVCRLHESLLITGGTAIEAELGRGLVVLTESAIAAGESAIELLPSKVSRRRFDADLVMNHCTLTSERSIVQVGPWLGSKPGPDRPWLITSRHCAFLAMYERKTRETVLLRSDADALARGTVSWQASDDAFDVDFFTAVGTGLPSANRPRDLHPQWVHFWGYRHMNGRITGPRGAGSPPSVRFFDKLRPGQVEPADLLLNRDYHPDRDTLNVGADLGWLGVAPRINRYGRQRN